MNENVSTIDYDAMLDKIKRAIGLRPRAPGVLIRKVLVASTMHVPPDTLELLDDIEPNEYPGTILKGERGWMILVPADEANWDYRYGLDALFEFVLSHGCDYVLLDNFVKPFPNLPVYCIRRKEPRHAKIDNT